VLTIAQITDLHLTTGKDPLNQQRNALRLRQVLAAVHALKPRPVAIVASGDLVDRGEPGEYAELAAAFADCEIPVHFALGNHDNRANFLEAFEGRGARTDANGFVQYVQDFGDLRLVVCDTLEQGEDGGGFCDDRAAWLAETLDQEPARDTVVVLHHPPILSGIQWMDPEPEAPWIQRLAEVVRGRDQVRAIICGHTHRALNGQLAGRPVAAAPASSIQLTLDLRPVDMDRPDGREILVDEPPGFLLVMADRGQVTTHVCVAGDYAPAVTSRRAWPPPSRPSARPRAPGPTPWWWWPWPWPAGSPRSRSTPPPRCARWRT
jgi:Icc protein